LKNAFTDSDGSSSSAACRGISRGLLPVTMRVGSAGWLSFGDALRDVLRGRLAVTVIGCLVGMSRGYAGFGVLDVLQVAAVSVPLDGPVKMAG
jgi:hypothetical protein